MATNKQTIIDLVNKIKYEVTEEQMAELSGCATPLGHAEFVDWRAKVEGMDLSAGNHGLNGEVIAELRAFLLRVLEVTREMGGRMVPVGKRVVRWIFSMVERHPKTAVAVVVMAALCFIVGAIPILGAILLPIAQLVAIGIVGLVFVSERRGSARALDVDIR